MADKEEKKETDDRPTDATRGAARGKPDADGPKPSDRKGQPGDSAEERAPAKDGPQPARGGTDEREAQARKAKSRRSRSVPAVGVAHIKATFNNTIVSITDQKGGVIAWSSAGKAGFKGSRKSTAFAATLVGQDAARQASGHGMREVEVHVTGAGSGRESAIRAIQASGLSISVIKDVTPIPHNGCRPRKRRRV